MDNNYEQSFMQGIKQPDQPSSSSVPSSPNAKKAITSTVISIVLACIVIIESIALVVLASRPTPVQSESEEDDEDASYTPPDDSPAALNESSNLVVDDNYTIIAFDLTCTAEDNSKYEFTKSYTFQKTNAASEPVSSGTYSIVKGGAVVLQDPQKPGEDAIVYYDGYSIMEGLTFYSCD